MEIRYITELFNVRGVPVFYILDNNKIIRKIVRGYANETTDKEIRDTIEELL